MNNIGTKQDAAVTNPASNATLTSLLKGLLTVLGGVAPTATATLSNTSGSASNVTLLAANSSRKGAAIHNDSTAILYVKLGATASATSFTVAMGPQDYYEVPYDYTGKIDGIWSSATGAARVTELA
jgi:hypothetical protein